MKFGEKIKTLRAKKRMTQEELARRVGVSLRTLKGYESGEHYPRNRGLYKIMADVLDVDINYLLTEDVDFILRAKSKYGEHGGAQARALLSEITGLFAGGDLAPEDMDEMMRAIQDAYWIAKEKNKKYSSGE